MPEMPGLMSPVAVESDGMLYVVGIRDGYYRVRRSADGGQSWQTYPDGTQERAIGPATSEQRAGLVKLTGQGRPLLACVPDWPDLLMYVSADDGYTWDLESSL